jgi:SWI/SNF related-matrix-associated actin-dependent regulator of chromatin subfamily C
MWTETAKEELAEAVLEESAKRRKLCEEGEAEEGSIDWNAVAARMQNGAGPIDCERAFLYTPLAEGNTESQAERSITPDMTGSDKKEESPTLANSQMKEKIIKEIIDQTRPEVIQAATDAALRATQNLAEAQRAAIMGLVASQATERALREEENVSRLMAELHEQRLQKLENRLALMDDVEGMLEAERVALELERRDLYTARCRHWFSGAS